MYKHVYTYFSQGFDVGKDDQPLNLFEPSPAGYCENCPCTDDGWSPLLIATQRRDAESVETLLSNGAEVDCKEPQSGWQLGGMRIYERYLYLYYIYIIFILYLY